MSFEIDPNDLIIPKNYGVAGQPHELWSHLRENAPVFRCEADPYEHFWAITKNGEEIGNVSRCVYSPRLEKNIGWANVPTECSEIGTEISIDASDGERLATVCDAPWVKSEIKIPPLA